MRKFCSLAPEDRRFAFRAWLLAPVVELSLGTAGLAATLRRVEGLTRPARERAFSARSAVATARGEQLVAAVYRHHFVRGACLPRALLQYGLHRLEGQDVRLVIGVKRPDQSVAAHAWVAPAGTPPDDVSREADAPGSSEFQPLFVRGRGVASA